MVVIRTGHTLFVDLFGAVSKTNFGALMVIGNTSVAPYHSTSLIPVLLTAFCTYYIYIYIYI